MPPRRVSEVLDEGTLTFSVEGRLLRELGERLVRQPEIAILELVKNAYDADASVCDLEYVKRKRVRVKDDGSGMTLKQFTDGWMRIGTSAKAATPTSGKYGRQITGEKGIGRFAVRFLGRHLQLVSVAYDPKRKFNTRLTAIFDWETFDRLEDLGKIKVPYTLVRAEPGEQTGTMLEVTELRRQTQRLRMDRVRTGSMGIVSPLRPLYEALVPEVAEESDRDSDELDDPGFSLRISGAETDEGVDVADQVLDAFVFRALVSLEGSRLKIDVFRPGETEPYEHVVDRYRSSIGSLRADIRFFPRRKGVFAGAPVDGRIAYGWVKENSGVAVFDRGFRVQPYGSHGDDWLSLAADAARNERAPRSSIANKHYPMSEEVRRDTAENWMLRLPQSAQLVGLVLVEGRRVDGEDDEQGLIAAADREGFVSNDTFDKLVDVVRGAVEVIAVADRRLQREQDEEKRAAYLEGVRQETRAAVEEIESSETLAAADKRRLIDAVRRTQELAERHEAQSRERERQLEVMSLLGVVAGFMTHEFGTALQDLVQARKVLRSLVDDHPELAEEEAALGKHIKRLQDFATYSTGYIAGSKSIPEKRYPVRPRLRQMTKVFGEYAADRGIDIEVVADNGLLAPQVPVALYNGVALNLYTNALKAVTARPGRGERVITFRAWNEEETHCLEVSDTGVGVPQALRERVFDPLFTTTDTQKDPLGSGMGLGLALVKRGVEAFGGNVKIVDPPHGFVTCVRVEIPTEAR